MRLRTNIGGFVLRLAAIVAALLLCAGSTAFAQHLRPRTAATRTGDAGADGGDFDSSALATAATADASTDVADATAIEDDEAGLRDNDAIAAVDAAVVVDSAAPVANRAGDDGTGEIEENATSWIAHPPVQVAWIRQPLALTAEVRNAQRVLRVECVYRIGTSGAWRTEAFSPGGAGQYRASLPAARLEDREIQYYLRVVERTGTQRNAFGSEAEPHRVFVRQTSDDALEARELADFRGNRSEFMLRGEYVSFGSPSAPNGTIQCPNLPCPDWYYQFELTYRYRFFRLIRSLNFGAGSMRARTTSVPASGVPVTDSPVGLDYGYADLELRLIPELMLSLRVLLGANEVTVQPGGGFSLAFLPSHATRVTFRYQGVLGVGNLFSGWMHWFTIRDTPMGAGIEITNFPGGNAMWATRLLFEAGRRFGRHLTIGARIGYQARMLEAGMISAGGWVSLEF